MMLGWWILAQAASQTTTAPSQMSTDAFMRQLLPMILLIVVFFWWISRSQKKERRKFQDMLSGLKRNDRVQTIGGILGTVVDVRDNEVVLKVDESSNVKIRFNRGAIKEVLSGEAAPAPVAEAKK